MQGRVTREVRADGTTDTLYTYDGGGRLKTITDPKDQVTTYTCTADDQLASMVFTNAQIATPSVSYTYDAAYPRAATMVDGIGTTSYTYHAAGQLGARQVASVDGPLTDDTITYVYDELGRVTTRAINGAANTVTWAFDALGRVTTETNVLGTFGYGYDAVSGRIASVSYPNGQTSAYSYVPAAQDLRLQTIHHKYPNGTARRIAQMMRELASARSISAFLKRRIAASMSWALSGPSATRPGPRRRPAVTPDHHSVCVVGTSQLLMLMP